LHILKKDLSGCNAIHSFSGNKVYYEILANDSMELPRINYRQYNTKDYRFVYAVGSYDFAGRSDWPLVKVDIRERRCKVWSENDCYPGEPVFVPRPDGIAEDDGIILSVVLDSERKLVSTYLKCRVI